MKRLFDIFCSFMGLLVLSPVFAVVAILIKLDSRWPVFFRQKRIGRNFEPFQIYKFRTMVTGAEKKGSLITVCGDARITRFGKFLRKSKIDELPQLLNVLKGEMSLVGPRPEVEKYVRLFEEEYGKLLSIRPGMTDPASLKYSAEERVLGLSGSWEDDYIKKILPEKINLSLQYLHNHNVVTDVFLIVKTICKMSQAGQEKGQQINLDKGMKA